MGRIVSRVMVVTGLVLATVAVSEASTLGQDVIRANAFILNGTGRHNLGWQFQVNSAVTMDGLGIFDDAVFRGLSESHQVGLWDNSGNLLASTTVTIASTHVRRY